MSQPLKVDPDLNYIRDLKSRGADTLKKCYQCATCSVVCDLSPEDSPFPRKEMIWAGWGMKDQLMADPNVWLCHQCQDCTAHCPRGAKPGDTLGAVRMSVIEGYSIPSFVGKAMSSPKGLPFLLAIAAVVVFALVWWTGERKGLDTWGLSAPLPAQAEGGGYEGGYFGNFLEHGPVEMIFIGGNFLVFILLAFSLKRFWSNMQAKFGREGGPSFIACMIETIKEIIPHSSFKKCNTQKARTWPHLFVLYGFFGAMATAGLAVLDMMVLGNEPPLPLFHPIKILGNVSMILLLVGSVWLIQRRFSSDEKAGASNYTDWVFLLSIFVVSLTGGLTQLGRNIAGTEPALSYAVYYVHMVAVFFLLWYMPYSKFAHMFYRTLGIAFAKSLQRSKN